MRTDFTAEQLLALPRGTQRYELQHGELSAMGPAGWRHGVVAARIGRALGNHVDRHDLGSVFAAETGCLLERGPDTVRAADVAFVSRARMAGLSPAAGFFPGAPDLAVEVLSPGDRATRVRDKVACWLAAGCQMAWVVDPERRCGEVHRPQAAPVPISLDGTLDGGSVVPGFALPLAVALQD